MYMIILNLTKKSILNKYLSKKNCVKSKDNTYCIYIESKYLSKLIRIKSLFACIIIHNTSNRPNLHIIHTSNTLDKHFIIDSMDRINNYINHH